MMLKLLLSVLALAADPASLSGTVWQIGEKDGRTDGFALAPDGFAAYLEKDFGWEDRYYIVGRSDPQTDFPYILPGPADGWGGTSGTAGIRTHVQNILFSLEAAGGDAVLVMDFAGVNDSQPPLLKVTVNGKSFKKLMADDRTLAFPVGDVLREGSNAVRIESIEGSWLTFDDIRLEGSPATRLAALPEHAYFKGAEAADYQLSESVQPLLVNVLHLSGRPELTVWLDGGLIGRKTLEKGEYILEIPMPAVQEPKESRYEIRFDGVTAGKGRVRRSPCPVVSPADYVDTYLGSAHSRWMLAPGPWAPFGLVKLAPDNQSSGWQAGYDPSFESIGTFSHVHEWTMAGLGTMPTCGPLKTEIGDPSETADWSNAYRSRIDKASEVCRAGYYSVLLTDSGIRAELTATTRCGFQRYTFPAGCTGRVMIGLQIPAEYSYDILQCDLRQTGERRIEGWSRQETRNVWSSDADQYYTLHFVLEFDRDITAFGQAGEYLYYAEFDASSVQLRSSLSYVDGEGARNNLLKEVTEPFGWDFEAVREAQKEAWNDILSRVRIETDDYQQKVRFYTNLYRCFCRNISSDADGRWMDAGGEIRRAEGPDGVALGGDAFWNTFWNLNPLWNLVTPEWSSRWVRSELAMYRSGGWLAKGPAGMKYIPVMVAEHEIPMMVSAWQMGIRDYDGALLLEAAKKMQLTPAQKVGRGFAGNRDLTEYMRHGYVPCDKGRFSNTMEYAFDDWAVSQLALAMGQEDDWRYFAERGGWWRHAIDPESGYCRLRRSDGSWEENFDPFRSGANDQYVEGNAWQLTYFVPQDVPALADLIGRSRFTDRLEWGFQESEKWRYNAPGDQYWDFPVVQGNQQSMHFAYLFNYVGKPWLTQRWSRSIAERYYGFHASDAWLGDEDQGQMSAWLVLTSLGLFQMDGGCRADPYFDLGSPMFDKVTLDLRHLYGRGGTFVIEAENASRENIYVKEARLNGEPLSTWKIPASELLKGGLLTVKMGPEPAE